MVFNKRSYAPRSLILPVIGGVLLFLFMIVALLLATSYPSWHRQMYHQMLWQAVMRDDAARAEYLLNRGANVNARDEWKNPLLVMALVEGHNRAARLLLRFHPDVNAVNPSAGVSALVGACGMNPTGTAAKDIVQALLNQGADINAQSRGGTSPLSVAAITGNAEIVALLLKQGADPQQVNDRGKTIIEVIQRRCEETANPITKAKLSNVLRILQKAERNRASGIPIMASRIRTV